MRTDVRMYGGVLMIEVRETDNVRKLECFFKTYSNQQCVEEINKIKKREIDIHSLNAHEIETLFMTILLPVHK